MRDESYIQIALELAKKGKGSVSPAPLVGALVVKNDKIISAAYRTSAQEESTEIIALKNSKETLEGAVLYSNLEPCTIFEKDLDCIDFIINSKISKVVIGLANQHPQFGGAAIRKFKKAGIEVKVGVLEKECLELNRFYFKYSTKGIPYVALKMAVTLDGRIADDKYNSKWITSVESRSMVHELRCEFDSVLVGIKTVKKDNPKLTVRLVEGRNPKRIILDSELEISASSSLVKNNSDANLIIITSEKSKEKKHKLKKLYDNMVEVLFTEEKKGKIGLNSALKKLGEKNITSVLVEGGGKIFSSFIKEKLDDELLIFIGPKILGGGIPLAENLGIKSLSKAYNYTIKDMDKIGEDALLKLVRR